MSDTTNGQAPSVAADIQAALRDVTAAATGESWPEVDSPLPMPKTMPELIPDVMAMSDREWVTIRVAGAYGELVSIPLGAILVLMGSSGRGKSTFAAQVAAYFCESGGWVLFISAELAADELAARTAGIRTEMNWKDVMQGKCTLAQLEQGLAGLSRFAVIDGPRATLEGLKAACAQMKALYPNMPGLVVIDYIGILNAAAGMSDERMRITHLVEAIRVYLQSERVAGLVISQVSRANAQGINSDKIIGADAAAVGAESSQLERAAWTTITLGAKSEAMDDGSHWVTVSVGKDRTGAGDAVSRANWTSYGRWRIDDPPMTSTAAKDSKSAALDAAATATMRSTVLGTVIQSTEPLTRKAIRSRVSGKGTLVNAAIDWHLDEGSLVELAECAPRTRYHLIWTPAQAEAHGRSRKAA